MWTLRDFHSDMWTREQIFTLTCEHANILNRVWPTRLRAGLLTHPVTNKMWDMWQRKMANDCHYTGNAKLKLDKYIAKERLKTCQILSDQKLNKLPNIIRSEIAKYEKDRWLHKCRPRVRFKAEGNMMPTNAHTNDRNIGCKKYVKKSNDRMQKIPEKMHKKRIKLTNVTTECGWRRWQRKRLNATRKFRLKKVWKL